MMLFQTIPSWARYICLFVGIVCIMIGVLQLSKKKMKSMYYNRYKKDNANLGSNSDTDQKVLSSPQNFAMSQYYAANRRRWKIVSGKRVNPYADRYGSIPLDN